MGTWSTASFGNDTAADWAFELEKATDATFIEATLDAVLDTGPSDPLDATIAERAVAAADVVARLRGRADVRDAYTEPADLWVKAHPARVPLALAEKAERVLDRILSAPSELLELWEESGEQEGWRQEIAKLRARLRK